MAPKQQRIVVQKGDNHGRRGGAAPKGYLQNVYGTLTSSENASVVRSVAIFGVCLFCFRLLVTCGWLWDAMGFVMDREGNAERNWIGRKASTTGPKGLMEGQRGEV